MTDRNLDPSRHAPSLWAATAPDAPPTAPLAPGEHVADLAVIGAGFTGLSAALHAAQRGTDVVVLEASEIGWGASGRNNGLAIPALTRADPDVLVAEFGPETGESVVAILRDSAQTLFELVRRHGIDCEAAQTGWIQPAHRESRLALSRSRFEQWRRRGAAVELLDRDRVAELTGSRFWYGGWRAATGGHLNPLAFARGLARAAIAAGARVHTRTPAAGIVREGDRWRVDTPAGCVRARFVVLATHGYSGLFAPDAWPGVRKCIVPARSYQMATRPLPDDVRRTVLPGNAAMSDTHADLHFGHFDARGRFVTGGALVIAAGYDERLRARIGARLVRMFPQLEAAGEIRFEHVWHGYFAATVDKLPRFHRLADGLVTWLGCNGRGVAFGTALGPVLADAAMGSKPALDALPFEPLRPIPAHALARRTALAAMLYYRWLDGRD